MNTARALGVVVTDSDVGLSQSIVPARPLQYQLRHQLALSTIRTAASCMTNVSSPWMSGMICCLYVAQRVIGAKDGVCVSTPTP